ncbi:hypothetical protein C8R44DRAFT_876236 [Mycena epipterygia]|nr:hypothetical protein C8R44DRAFT_876236 [Mycena epipterygia]
MASFTEIDVHGIYRDGIMAILRSLLDRDSATFFPNLRSIGFTAQNWKRADPTEDIDYDVLADALLARWKPRPNVARLESFSIVWVPTPVPSSEVWIDDVFDSRYEPWTSLGFDEDELRRYLANFGILQRFLDMIEDGMTNYIGTCKQQWVE